MLITVLIFLVMLSLLVFVHELGHFFVAKKMGMKVEEFGFGFPPKIFSIKKGETVYSINWIPMGGFVKIKGENGEDKNEDDSFASKKPWKRFCVLVAGVTMNVFFAAVLLSVGFMIGLPSQIESKLSLRAHISQSEFPVMAILGDSPIERAGIVVGDTFVSLDKQVFINAESMRKYIADNGSKGIDIEIKKEDGSLKTVRVVSEKLKDRTESGIGVAFVQTGLVSFPFFDAIYHGFKTAGSFLFELVKAFGIVIKNLVLQKETGMSVAGPVGIAVMTGQAARMGFAYLLQFAAILSLNLAIINILPLPALDGGRILFVLIEKIKGSAVNQKFESVLHNVGFILLMLLVVIVTYRDIAKFGGAIIGAIKNLIHV